MSENHQIIYNPKIAERFRGFLPVIVDVEAGGLNPLTDALLEIAAVTINCDDEGKFTVAETFQEHIEPFAGANLNPESLAINKIDPSHPFRFAVSEEKALTKLFSSLQRIQKEARCNRCVLVGHNAWFDLAYLNAAIERSKVKGNPFHAFTSFDTATLGALAYGHTVLAEALKRADIPFAADLHHSAIYDAQQTAQLFCKIINQWPLR
jgi:ribonuclease T